MTVGLPWIRVDSTLPANPKVLQLLAARQHKAINVYVFGLTWTGHQGTDGYIPEYALPMIHATRKDAQLLVEVGLWHEAPHGWTVNGWGDYQPSPEARARTLRGLEKARCTKAMKGGERCYCGQHEQS